jgi:histidinol-phosphate aminotransferase
MESPVNPPEPSIEPVPALERLSRYSVGRPPFETDLVLDFNESLEAFSAAGAAGELAELRRYPWTDRLEARLAASIGVDSERVIVTCGADDALERAVRAVCCPGRRALLVRPTYGMVRRYAILAGAEVREVPWWDGPFPVEQVVDAAGADTALLFLVSPNNPTGAVIQRAELEQLLQRLPRTLVLYDQAYREFAEPRYDLSQVALAHPNAVLVRTFSKAWGGAGLRAGYAVGSPTVIDWMRRVGQPFPVSYPSLQLVAAALENGFGPNPERVERIRDERDSLSRLLAALGAGPLPSQASFILARFDNAPWVRRALAALGIAVRGFPGRGELDGWLRTTLPGDTALFERLCSAFRTVLRPQALLFDLDGVIADTSRSYRRAIIETAAEYGVTLGLDEIAQAKAGGDANNDWILARRLLAARGVDASLDEVTERFEALYQGTAQRPGLRRNERLLVEARLLRRLAARLPLAVVTGRPRRDARRFLDQQGIADCFRTVVTLEDAPSKPDPAPVRVALERLGVSHAWMVGDTPDDLRAARGAGVLPLGVVAPSDDPERAATALAGAGAARVLTGLDTMLEDLP